MFLLILNQLNECIFLLSDTFAGVMTAFGAGNDATLNSAKAGPGTIYRLTGRSPQEIHTLTITGDTDSSMQAQTYTYISGASLAEFKYNNLVLSGMWHTILSEICIVSCLKLLFKQFCGWNNSPQVKQIDLEFFL